MSQAPVRLLGVILLPPAFDMGLRLGERREVVLVQALAAK